MLTILLEFVSGIAGGVGNVGALNTKKMDRNIELL